MTWQTLLWNIFVWSFTGLMIYLTNSSLWWLLLPAMFTGTHNAAEIVRGARDAESAPSSQDLADLDPKAKQEFFNLIIKNGKDNRKS